MEGECGNDIRDIGAHPSPWFGLLPFEVPCNHQHMLASGTGSVATSTNDDRLIHGEVSEEIVGAAMHVLNKLKPGLKEKAYENALAIELRKRGHAVEQQRSFEVFYDGIVVDTLVPDMIVDGKVIVDPKCVTEFNETHYAQMIGYLAITNLRLAILFNFKAAKLRWKRIVR